MNFFQRFLTQARDLWTGLSTPRRVGVVLAAVVAVGAVAGLLYLSNAFGTGRYVALPYSVPPDQVERAQTRLTAAGVRHTLDPSTAEIRVLADDLPKARVALATEGFPNYAGKGLESFDETSFGATPFQLNVNYLRAIQVELARSILTIDAVASARVLIARPDPTPFVREQKPTTASVILKLKPGASFSRAAAASVVSLVSKSIEGLKPENVTVVDSTGRLLSDPHAGEKDDLPTTHLEYRRELESYLSSKAEEMLSRTLGAGRAVVRVTADINFQKVREQQVTYSPDAKVVTAERTTTVKSPAPAARGVAGATSNISRTGGTAAGGAAGGGSEETVSTDYLVAKTTRDLEDKMGAVTRLTIATLADLTPVEGSTPISRDEVEKIVKQAVGFKIGRDEIQVTNATLGVPVLAAPEIDEEAVRLQRLQGYAALARNICIALGVVTTAGLATLLLLRGRRGAAPAAAQAPAPFASPASAPAPVTPLPPPDATPDELLSKFAAMATAEPDRVAGVLGAMLGGKP